METSAADNKFDEWRIWQLLDSAFPAGGFAHSSGIEAAWQAGWMQAPGDLERFLHEFLTQLVHGSLPFVGAAVGGTDIIELDRWLDSLLSNHVANRASRLQGMAFLSTAERVFGGEPLEVLRVRTLREDLPGHHAVMFGAVMRILRVDAPMAVRMFIFMSIRGVLSAAVRMGAVGPLEAQRVQLDMGGAMEAAAARAAGIPFEDACQTAPLLELWQMGQDRLYSRLFQS